MLSIPVRLQELPDFCFAIANVFHTCTFSKTSALRRFGQSCFESSNLEKIQIPGSVIELANSCFQNCPSLSFVGFSSNSALRIIGDFCFARSGITSFKVPKNVELIGNEAFRNCSWLESCDLSQAERLTRIGNLCFESSVLASIAFPRGLQTIGENAFRNCQSLKSCDFAKAVNLTNFPRGCFSNCAIAEFRLPSTIQTIGESCFEDCPNLQRLVIDGNAALRQIEKRAFASTKVAWPLPPPSLEYVGVNAFGIPRDPPPVSILDLLGAPDFIVYFVPSVSFQPPLDVRFIHEFCAHTQQDILLGLGYVKTPIFHQDSPIRLTIRNRPLSVFLDAIVSGEADDARLVMLVFDITQKKSWELLKKAGDRIAQFYRGRKAMVCLCGYAQGNGKIGSSLDREVGAVIGKWELKGYAEVGTPKSLSMSAVLSHFIETALMESPTSEFEPRHQENEDEFAEYF
jgi:hypothetical protein